ncbi:HD domain-containing phosphohydrolase [Pseudoalteromonas tunicata]|uniref:HD domain-containing phosphohydrolase n=1 Tax=Pseudoalteromonas tunicata TaxID=314281 RepID=UPI0027401FE0|nr:HD domain-containing phosphohydrolase [Pseudoalteromonas tunicata]MDP4984406.1 GAF domain-containing protein [Pseudoalteromonas tunicata]
MNRSLLGTLKRRNYFTDKGVYQDFLEYIVSISDSNIGYLHLFDEQSQQLVLNVWSKSVLENCAATYNTHYPLKEAGIWADAIRKRHTVVHNSYQQQASAQGLPKDHFPLDNHVAFPLFLNEQIIAVLGIGNKNGQYSQEDIAFIESKIADTWLLVRLKLAKIHEREAELETAFSRQSSHQVLLEMLKAISHALELRDLYTSNHQKNVAYICTEIAKVLLLPEKQSVGLYVGALIHDIGKMIIPSAILNKPGTLSNEELALLKTHPGNGEEIFKETLFPWPIKEMISQHHERIDGSGYPSGLTEHEICLEARIIAVADTFDAMANDRPYRKAPGKSKAIEEIKRGRGLLYDSYVVDAFLKCILDNPTFDGTYPD